MYIVSSMIFMPHIQAYSQYSEKETSKFSWGWGGGVRDGKDEVFSYEHTKVTLKIFFFSNRSGLMVASPMAFLSCLLEEL